MPNLQTFDVFGEVLVSSNSIIISATALKLDGTVINEVEVIDPEKIFDIQSDDPVRYIFTSSLETYDKSKSFVRQVAGPNISDVEPIHKAIFEIIGLIVTRSVIPS